MKKQKFVDLNNYIKQKKIGSGTFGEVFFVKDRKTGKLYAAKISIQSVTEGTAVSMRDLLREINIISKVNFPSIIKFIGFSPHDFNNQPKPVIITEYLSKHTLKDLIDMSRKSLAPKEWDDTHKLIVLYGIAAGMSYLHSHNILHRDLKPGNILFDKYSFPKIVDFGLSKDESAVNKSMTLDIKGTPLYIAPEIIEEFKYTKAGDVYAFAMIAYEMYQSQRPFSSEKTPMKIFNKVTKNVRPSFNDDIPDAYKELIERCWAPSMEDRPSFDEILEVLGDEESGFITDSVDRSFFDSYIQFINKSTVTFDRGGKEITIEDILGPKKSSLYKMKFSEDSKSSESSDFVSDSKSRITSSVISSSIYKKLDEKCQQIVDNAGNDPEALFDIGRCFIEEESNFPQNTSVGIKYLIKSIDKGSVDSATYYSRMLIKGDIIADDIEKAESILSKFDGKEESTVDVLNGLIQLSKKNYKKAFKFFKNAASLGNGEAMYNLGLLYKNGLGVSKNMKEANNYFNLAKKNKYEPEKGDDYDDDDDDDNEQLYEKGRKYLEGKGGCKVQIEKAINFFKRGAQNGSVKSMVKLAKIYSEGYEEKIDINSKLARKYYKMAADKGDVKSMNKYAMLIDPIYDKSNDEKEAKKYYKMAIENGNIDAMYNYGRMLEDEIEESEENEDENENLPVILEEAMKYIKMAADKGHQKAKDELNILEAKKSLYAAQNGDVNEMINYAKRLENGNGIEKNLKEARGWYLTAIKSECENNENCFAMTRYGQMCQRGIGGPVKNDKAIKYFKMAADQNYPYGMVVYGLILEHEKEGVEIKKKKAVKYYMDAAEMNDALGMKNYARCLEYGIGVKKDINKAKELYKKAADLGNKSARNSYNRLLKKEKNVKKQHQPKNKKLFRKKLFDEDDDDDDDEDYDEEDDHKPVKKSKVLIPKAKSKQTMPKYKDVDDDDDDDDSDGDGGTDIFNKPLKGKLKSKPVINKHLIDEDDDDDDDLF